ncbi:MAG: DNA alkylation repair protein [Burkholderiaceae bacterium]
MEPFKNLIDAQTVRDAAFHLARVWPAFPRRRFETLARAGLDGLEFKARALHLSAALEACLPEDFARAADILEASLGPPGDNNALGELRTTRAGLAGWVIWPMTEWVARRGLAFPERALLALRAMTQRSTAEFAIRPFIERYPDLSFAILRCWTRDPSAHVRRLVSEGSRPRLPWGMRFKDLIADPTPTLPLLLALQDDATEYVRRSVANHLNDIAKDHPAVVAAWLEQHLPGAPPQRAALLKHASRTLIKKGDPRTLKAWGLAQGLRGDAQLKLSKRRIALGETVELKVMLRSNASRRQKLAIDYTVHHQKANGSTTPKVFKGWTLDLAPHEQRELRKTHSLRPVTTRRYHAGRHRIELKINGRPVAESAFELRL